jgi:outer membrane biosynthesis protein TonB
MSMKSDTLSKATEPALEALRNHYQDQVTECEQAATSARSQLDHIQALLFHISVAPVRSFNTSALKTPPATSNAASEPLATPMAEAIEPSAPTKPAKTVKPAKTAKPANVKAAKAAKPAAKPATKPAAKPAAKAAKTAAITKAPTGRGKRAGITAAEKVEAPKSTSKKGKAKDKGGRNGKLKMKDSYLGKTMLDAIGMVLKANTGKAVSADSVVNSLYGALSDDQFRVAKDRVTKSLSKGKIDDMWDRVPNQLGVYTISASSLK